MTPARKVYICCDVRFPHGQAAANYIRFLSFLLRDAGHAVTVIGYLTEDGKKDVIGAGIAFRPYNGGGREWAGLGPKLAGGRCCVRQLQDLGLSRQDVVVYYASNDLFAGPVMRYARQVGCRVCACVVEWHQMFQYPLGAVDPRWLSNRRCFERTNCAADLVLPISERIESYYSSKGCRTRRLLPLVDTKSVAPILNRDREDGPVHLFYSGNPWLKDDLQAFLEGVRLLDPDEREQVRVVLLGVSRDELERRIPALHSLLPELGACVTIPGWLAYAELTRLYDQLDYLFLARFDNAVTQANYPSKVPEVMARGIPVIGSKTGDYWRDLADGHDSILFSETSPRNCRDAIRRAIALNGSERAAIRENARRSAERTYDYRNWLHIADSITGAE